MPRPIGAGFFLSIFEGLNVNYHAQFGGLSLENDRFMLILVPYLIELFCQFLWLVNVNYHAKFQRLSLKNN